MATSREVKKLNSLNGRDAAGASYLPYGEAAENNMNYEASVLPVAVGGYYWVLFTSRRAYGNEIAPDGVLAGGGEAFGNWGPQAGTPRKKLWVAALDVDHGVPDPSRPAFYLTGQERELCFFAANCCDAQASCVNKRCTVSTPVVVK